jgi:uncharacterized membrane protein YphA (DoxX/SURF4 family)
LRSILNSKLIQILSQLILGGVFIFAGLSKITDVKSFADSIRNYKLLPGFLVTLTSFILPVLEIIFGSLLVLNIRTRLSAIVLSSFLIIFIIALFSAFVRGININCGCFMQTLKNPELKKANEINMIIRDFLLLIPGILIISYGKLFNSKRAAIEDRHSQDKKKKEDKKVNKGEHEKRENERSDCNR